MPNSMTTLIRHSSRLACAAAMAAALAACDDSTVDLSVQEPTSPATTQPMTAVVSLGAVNAATANFYTANGATLLASGTTNANGSVTVQVPSTHTGPVIVEVLGDDVDAMYFDEAAGTLLPLAAGNRLRALVPLAGGAVAVTTLTELAYQIAVANNLLPISAADVSATNAAVLAALAPGLDSLLTVPTAFDASTGAGDLDDTPAGRHALVLAALANLAAGNATPALAVLDALIADLSDGQLNANVADVPYTDFIAEMRTALTSVANSFGTTALQNVAAGQAPASTTVGADNGGGNGGGDAPNGTTSPGTVAAALVSQYTLTAIENQPGSPYSDGDMVMAIVSDSTLQIDDGPVLTDPFVRSINGNPQTTEIIWLDTATNLEYALSNNETGVFNEINIGDAANPISQGIPGFLGQLVDQSTGGGEGPANIELVTAVAGTYTVTEVLEGSHQRGTVTIGDDGAIDYDTGLSFTPDQYEAIFDRLDCCMRVSVEFNEQGDGNKPRVDLFVDADGALERVVYFVDGFGSDGSEVRVGSGSDSGTGGSDTQGDAALGSGDSGVSATVDGVGKTIVTDATFNDIGDGYFGISIADNNGPDGAVRRWTMRAPARTGTHPCQFAGNDRPFNTEISLFDGAEFFSASGDTGCEIIVTTITTSVLEATFTANAAVQRDGTIQAVAIADGVVRLPAPDGFQPAE